MSEGTAHRAEPGHAARTWWRALQDEDHEGRPKRGDRAARARLRRASAADAMAEEAALALFHALGHGWSDRARLPRVATLAAILAHVREDGGERFGRAIGRQALSDADSALLKPIRFKNLVAAEGEEEILRAFRRAVDLLGGKVQVADLARTVLFFDREETRRDLAFLYYGAGAAQPGAPAP